MKSSLALQRLRLGWWAGVRVVGLLAVFMLFALAGSTAATSATAPYTAVDLGTLGGSTTNIANNRALDDAGRVVGESSMTPPPVAQVSIVRTRRVMPDASVDSIGADQPTSAMLTWSATLSNAGPNVLPAPRISVDGSLWTFVPPVAFPLSVTGAELQPSGMLNLTDLQGANHSHAVADNVTTGFDSARTMSPATIPPGGGTQTVTVTATLRDPATVGDSLSIQVTAGDLVHGAAVDVQSIVAPTTDPGSGATLSAYSGGLWWSLPAPALNATYTLTLQITVPNGTATALRYKPTVMVSLAEPRKYFPEETGLSTTIPDATLGGTFTFSAGSDVDWARRIVYSLSYVTFAPLATAADTTPPVLSLPADTTVAATGPNGAVVSFTATAKDDTDPSPTVSCTPTSGSTFAIGATTVTCTATDASGNTATGSFTVTVVDTTPPVLNVPANRMIDATSSAGAVVAYAVSATDTVDLAPVVTCTPRSGTTIPIGTTTVACRAADATGNSATASFTVHVRGAGEQLADLAVAVRGVGPGGEPLHDGGPRAMVPRARPDQRSLPDPHRVQP